MVWNRSAVTKNSPVFNVGGLGSSASARSVSAGRSDPGYCSPLSSKSTPCSSRLDHSRTRRLTEVRRPSERKIDVIDQRLENLTALLQELRTHVPRSSNHNVQNKAHPSPATMSSTGTPSDGVTPSVEGPSSLSAHSAFINDFVHNLVGADDSRPTDPEMHRTLDVLSRVVHDAKQHPSARESILPNARLQKPALEGSDLPPIQKAVVLINAAKGEYCPTGDCYFSMSATDFIHC